ncbi:MAG: hypothetical protein WAL14_14545, partial [Pseudolabrys sp.]
ALAVLKIFVLHPKKTFATISAHRVISVRCGNWSLSGHSGLWRAVRPADLWVHGLALLWQILAEGMIFRIPRLAFA